MTQSLIIADNLAAPIGFIPEALSKKTEALAASGLVWQVRNVADLERAVEAQKACKAMLLWTESSRKEAKAPVTRFGRLIEEAARDFGQELSEEQTRLAGLIADFHAAERRIADQRMAEERKQLEAQRDKAIEKAATPAQVTDAHRTFFAREAQAQMEHQPPRVEGQVIADDWEITVTDIHLLYRCHPNCVHLEERTSEIKGLLKMGVKVQGVLAKPIVKAGVRLSEKEKQKALGI